jgi:tetratricopeptide (TPR) repeat protein
VAKPGKVVSRGKSAPAPSGNPRPAAAAPAATKGAAPKAQKPRPTIVPPKPAIKVAPEQALLEKAQRALSVGDVEQAERVLEKMIVDFPDDPRGRCVLGNLKRRRGDEKGALEEYGKVLRRTPGEPTALWYKAELHLSQKPAPDFAQAVACYKKIVQTLGRKKDDRAKKYVEEAKKQLRFCEARKLSLQGRRYLTSQDTKQIKKGRDLFAKALALYPEDHRNHMNLGVALLLLEEPERAAKLCQEAIELNPKYARAHLMLGRALRRLRRLRLAKDAFLKCIELDRSGRDAQDAWNDRREVERDMAKVRLTLFQALSGRPGDDGEKVRLTLAQMKQMVSMLEGDAIDGADLTLDARGSYTLTAYSQRHRFRYYPGPESLVGERDGLAV